MMQERERSLASASTMSGNYQWAAKGTLPRATMKIEAQPYRECKAELGFPGPSRRLTPPTGGFLVLRIVDQDSRGHGR
jgi:hypothetical protein